MASHLEIGKEGEKLAEIYLAKRDYVMLQRNWRHSRFEIDLVATKDGMLRFIEVKFRSSNQFGQPEEAVTRKKVTDLLKAIDQYIYLNPQYDDFRLDILSITQHRLDDIKYFLIEDVHL